ncbi:MAG: hypothetical protein HUU10_14540 [Bacteroidetes bacterium]|nr:hypothetical protein [Bacteroidota bacterium]
MRFLVIVSALFLTLSCSDSEVDVEYPNGITKPESVSKSGGCGNLEVYQYINETSAIVVNINANSVQLTKKLTEFNLTGGDENISISYLIAGNSTDSIYFNFCNDIAYPNMGKNKVYKAHAGNVFVTASKDLKKGEVTMYKVTIRITDVYLKNMETNESIFFSEIIYWDVFVGWFPG